MDLCSLQPRPHAHGLRNVGVGVRPSHEAGFTIIIAIWTTAFWGSVPTLKAGSPAFTPGLALTPGRRAGVAQVGALGPCSMLGVGGLPSACGRGRDGVGSCPGVNPHLRSARLDLPPAAGRDPDPRTRCRVRSGQPRPQVTARGR